MTEIFSDRDSRVSLHYTYTRHILLKSISRYSSRCSSIFTSVCSCLRGRESCFFFLFFFSVGDWKARQFRVIRLCAAGHRMYMYIHAASVSSRLQEDDRVILRSGSIAYQLRYRVRWKAVARGNRDVHTIEIHTRYCSFVVSCIVQIMQRGVICIWIVGLISVKRRFQATTLIERDGTLKARRMILNILNILASKLREAPRSPAASLADSRTVTDWILFWSETRLTRHWNIFGVSRL